MITDREEMERYYTGDIPDDEASEATADTTDESSTDNGEDDSKCSAHEQRTDISIG
jgi:hypothetical protein